MNKIEYKLRSIRGRRRWLVAATVIVWICAISASFVRFRLAAQGHVTVVLSTMPNTIRLTLNGQKYADGAYVETPVKIPVAPGKNRFKIFRDGYVPHIVSVEGEAGDTYRMEGVTLQKKPDTNFGRLAVEAAAVGRGLFAEIDDGFARGELPLIIDDLVPTKPHSLVVYPNWPEKTGLARCQVPSKSLAKLDDPQIVKVRLGKKGRLMLQGCLAEKTPQP